MIVGVTSRMRVVGVGAPDRGDDQLGLVAARRLRTLLPRWAEVREDVTGGTRLTQWCEGTDRLVVIDAMQTGPRWPVGCHLRLAYPQEGALLAEAGLRGTHTFSVRDALALAATLKVLPAQVVLHALAAENFQLGTGLSEVLLAPLEGLVQAVVQESRDAC